MQEYRRKYLLLCFLVVLFFITGVFIYYYINRQTVKRNRIANLQTIALFKGEQISNWYGERIANATFYTTSPFSVDIYSRYVKEGSAKAMEQINQRNNLIIHLYGFEKVSSIDLKKKEIIQDTLNETKIPDNVNKYIDSAILTKRIYITNFYLTEKLGKPQNAIVAPVKTSQQEVLAIMIFYINPEKYLGAFKKELPLSYRTSRFTFISPLGDSVMALNVSKTSLTTSIEHSFIKSEELTTKFAEKDYTENFDKKIKKSFSVLVPVPNLPWYILYSVDKKEIWAEINSRTLIFATILFLAIVGFLISIYYLMLERKARKNLTLVTTEQENFFNHSIDMLCIADKNGYFRRLNPEWERVLGYSLTELEGRPFIEFVHPEDIDSTIEATNKLASKEKISDFVNRYRHKNGSYRWIEWRSFPEDKFIYASARDITERKETEQKLQENIVRAQAFSDATNEGIIISDNGIIVEANKQALSILGYKDFSEIIGKSILEELTPPEFYESTVQHITSNSIEPYETISYRKDKSKIPIEIKGRPIMLRGKKMRVAAFRDLTGQKRAEQEIRETNYWLRASQRTSHIGSYKYDIANDIWKSSEELDAIFGITPDYERTSIGWGKIIHHEHQQEMMEHLLKHVIEQHNPFNKEYRIIRQNDGEVRWVHGLGNLNYDKNGNPIQMIGTIQDITEQKKAQEEIIIKEQRFRSIFENSSLGVAVVGLDGKYLMVNNAMCQIMGYSSDELLNMTLFQLTHPDDVEKSSGAMEDLINRSSVNTNFTKRYIHKDGRIIWTELNSRLLYGTDNKPLYYITHVNDITERKIAEDARKENEEKFRIAFDNSPTGMSMIRSDGHYVAVNQMLCNMFGYSAEELLSGTINKITHPDDIERSYEWIKKKIAGDESEPEFEKRFIHKDGHIVWGLLRSQWIRNEDGSPRMSVTHVLDVTDRKKVEAALKESEAKARLFVENVPMPVAMFDTEMRYLMTSKRWSIDYKLGDQPLLGRTHYEVFPEIGDVWKNDHQRVLAGEIYRNDADRFERTDGTIQWLRYELYPWRKGDNSIGGLIMFTEDITERKKAEEALIQSEQKYRLLFENMTGGFALHQMIYDDQGKPCDYRYIEANPAFGKLTGLPINELIGKTIKEVIPNIEDHWIQSFGQVALTGEPMYYMNFAEGLGRYYETYVFSPEKDKFAVVFNDATDRVKAENSLRESEARLRSFIDGSYEGIAIINENGILEEWNKSAETILKVSKQEVINKSWREVFGLIFPSEAIQNIELFEQTIKEAIQTININVPPRNKYSKLFPEGMRHFEQSLFTIKTDTGHKLAIIFIDITEQVRIEEALANTRTLNDALMASIPGLVYMYDDKGYLVNWNKRHEEETGYSAEELYHKYILDWYQGSEEDIAAISAGLEKVDKEGYGSTEGNLQKKNGEKTLYYFTAVKIIVDGKKYFTGIGIDITEKKRAEEELKTLYAELENKVIERTHQLEQANKDLESFAYSVSHDLRAPIRHIDGFLRLLYSNIESPSESITSYYEKINGASKRMSGMIDELLTFSRLGRKDLTLSKVDMNVIVNEIVEQIKPDTTQRQIQWDLKQLPTIPVDHNLIKFAFENLISNAIKYTSKKPLALIEIGCSEDTADNVTIYIKDNGEGFDMAFADKLFGVFQRLHKPEEFEGIGIGLANVKQIISKHKGTIIAQAKVNEGATFFVTLPK